MKRIARPPEFSKFSPRIPTDSGQSERDLLVHRLETSIEIAPDLLQTIQAIAEFEGTDAVDWIEQALRQAVSAARN